MSDKPRCFMAMPITTSDAHFETYGDRQHWAHVMEHRFEPAITAAGFEPVRPGTTGATLIHAEIVKKLETCDLVLCDMSGLNANVFFELGVRTSLDKPVCLVKDDKTRTIPFDTSGINTHTYSSDLRPWNEKEELAKLEKHIRESDESCDGRNPMWKQFGLTIRAQEPTVNESPADARLDLLLDQVSTLVRDREETMARRGEYVGGGGRIGSVGSVVGGVTGGVSPGMRSAAQRRVRRLADGTVALDTGPDFQADVEKIIAEARYDGGYILEHTADGAWHIETDGALTAHLVEKLRRLAEVYDVNLSVT